MGETAGDTYQGGSDEAGVGELFQGGSAAGASVWGGDMGGVPDNGAGTERVHPWGGGRITGRQLRRGRDGMWFYPSSEG